MKIIENAEAIDKFDADLFFRIIEKMIVSEGEKVIETLFDGNEVEVVI